MARHVVLLRAVNVAGHGVLKMDVARQVFAAAGARGVETFIQSGNVLFESPAREAAAIVRRARGRLGALLGNEPGIILRSLPEFERLVEVSPFRGRAAAKGA